MTIARTARQTALTCAAVLLVAMTLLTAGWKAWL
jgi:hypothetical protein